MSRANAQSDAGSEFAIDKDPEWTMSELEIALKKRGFERVSTKYYQNPDTTKYPYIVQTTKDPNKAKVIFGYNLLDNKAIDELDAKVRHALRSEQYLRRSMPPTQRGSDYAVGFSIKYNSPKDVFTNAQNVCNNIHQIILDYFHSKNIPYIGAELAFSILIDTKHKPKK